MLTTKVCLKCKTEKPVSDFYKAKVGIESRCKVCRLKTMKVKAEARKANPAVVNLSGAKKCTQCLNYLAKTEFSLCARQVDGLQQRCSKCQSQCVKNRYRTVEGQISHRLAGSSVRAKQKNIPFNLDKDFLLSLYRSQGGLCAITGLAMQPDRESSLTHRNPFAISIDRIDSKKGYVKDNVRLTTVLGNQARSAWTDQDFLDMSIALLRYTGFIVEKGETTND